MVVHDLNVSGGIHKLVLRLAQELGSSGHQLTVYTLSADKHKCYPNLIKKINVVTLFSKPLDESIGIMKFCIILLGPFIYMSRFKRLAKKMNTNYDSIVVHDPLSLYSLFFYKSNKKPRTVWMLNNQLPKYYGHTKRVREELQPALSGFRLFFLKVASIPALLVNYLAERKSLEYIDKFAVYDSHNQKLVKKYLGKKATNVYAGADLEIYAKIYKKSRFYQKATVNILSVGIIAPHRRYEDLLRAASHLRKSYPLTVNIVGLQTLAPDYFNKLLILAKNLKISDIVTFENRVSDKKMLDLYRKADVFVFINDAETWGVSVFEAIAAGIPVVITNNIGAADLVTNEYGWIVKPRSPKQVEKALKEIIDNPLKARRVVRKSVNEVAPRVSWRAYSKRMLNLIDSVNA